MNTIRDVAKRAGVSQATASRVLNGSVTVNPELKKRVLLAAEELRYTPNLAGRNLRMKVDPEYGPEFEIRAHQNRDVKHKIAAHAAQLVEPNDSIVLDSGSTVSEMTSLLPSTAIIYTNSLAVLQPAAKRDLKVYVAPGMYVPTMAAVFGEDTDEYFQKCKPNKYFLSTARIDVQTGLFNFHPGAVQVKQTILRNAGRSILLADHDKFCDAGLTSYAPIHAIDVLITDYVPEPYREHMSTWGISVIEVAPL